MESTCGSPERSDSFFLCVKAVVYLFEQKIWLYESMSPQTSLLLSAFSGPDRRANPAERRRERRLLEKVIDATQTGAQPSCWELLEVCEGLWCITCVLVCCSAPAEGRTIRLWSARCGPPGIFLGVWGSMLFLLQLLVSLSASLCTYWLDFGLFKASLWINTTQTINGASLTLVALFLPLPLPLSVVCVSWHQALALWKSFSGPELSQQRGV